MIQQMFEHLSYKTAWCITNACAFYWFFGYAHYVRLVYVYLTTIFIYTLLRNMPKSYSEQLSIKDTMNWTARGRRYVT